MFIVALNYRDITKDVLKIDMVAKEMEIGQSKVNASQCTIELNNVNGEYDDDLPHSVFYATNWYNKPLTVVDMDNNATTVFVGKIKHYEADEKSAKIQATNYFKDLLDITCDYTQNNLTAPEHIYNIITNAGLLPSIISYGAYITAVTNQQAEDIKINVAVTEEANYNCLDVIDVLCKMSGLELYDNYNTLVMNSWHPYRGEQGIQILDEHYIPGTFKQYYEDKLFFNKIVCAYSTGTTIAYYTETDEMSTFQYNITKTQKLPENNLTSTELSDYRVYYTNATSAQHAASLLLNKYKKPLKYCEFSLKPEFAQVQIGDILNVYFGNLNNEPIKILKTDFKEDTIHIKAMYLNKPTVYHEIVTEIIDPVRITSIVQKGNTELEVQFLDPNDNTFRYAIYFRPMDGDWVGTNSLQGLSPIEINADALPTQFGVKQFTLTGLNPKSGYQVKIVAITHLGTRSDYSNSVALENRTDFNVVKENKYCTTGNLFSGITIDIENREHGYLPSPPNDDWVLYDSVHYGERHYAPNAVYETPLITNDTGFKAFYWEYECLGLNDIKFQYKINDETTWSRLYEKEEMNYFVCPENTKSIRFRFVFYSVDWADSSFIKLNRSEV